MKIKKTSKPKPQANGATVVMAIQCPICKDTVYSRARHDFRSCSCEAVSVDGGFDYLKVSVDEEKTGKIKVKPFKKTVHASRQDLLIDWSRGHNNFGLIKAE